ncbi:MAG: 2-succinyl-5-enolpyruvyl-6-hydroxy-3-cyclohexene-1-carboxylic-acid synthase [Myxococcales bacterium]|nr:2-succinyl-5-enolpyruvyl-6-hydroxy-3-cyclohexene-1-carboxylic-acid synthase [Myxococcales bacterium]
MNQAQSTRQATAVRTLMALLVRHGVAHIFVAPGSRSTPLVQAAAELTVGTDEANPLRMWPVLDERAAGFVALGASREGQLSAVVCTSGSAVAHLLPAAIEAKESGTCILLVTADRPVESRNTGAPQAILQLGIFSHYADSIDIDCALQPDWSKLQSELALAIQHGRPLHLNVALDTPLALATPAQADPLPQLAPVANAYSGPPIEPPQAGENVLVIAGPLPAALALAVQPLLENYANITATFAEIPSNLAHLFSQPGPFRSYDAWLRDPELRLAALPDRVVRLGEWPVSKGLQLLLEACRDHSIPVDVVAPGRVSDPLKQARVLSFLPPVLALARWTPPAAPRQPSVWLNVLHDIEAYAQVALLELTAQATIQVCEAGLLPQFLSQLPEGSPVQLANSMTIRDGDGLVTTPPRLRIGFSRGANGIDGTLATAYGRALALDCPTWVALGDAAFLHDINSLALVRLRPQLKVLVLDNCGGAIFDNLPAAAVIDPSLHRTFFTQPHTADLAKIAQGFGLSAAAVTGAAGADQILSWARGDDGPQVMVFQCDPAVSPAVRHRWQQQALAGARQGRAHAEIYHRNHREPRFRMPVLCRSLSLDKEK